MKANKKRILMYSRLVAELRTCRVSFRDHGGLVHSVEVTAASLFEAAALAVKAFRTAEWMDSGPGSAAVLEISVLRPVARHRIPLGKVMAWLESNGRTPKEQASKQRLREMLDDR